MLRLLLITALAATIAVSGCAGRYGRIVSPEELARYEGAGRIGALRYYGADDYYHYFGLDAGDAARYRVRVELFDWHPPLAFRGYRDGEAVTDEVSERFLESKEITVDDTVPNRHVIEILYRRGKDPGERWVVTGGGEAVRIFKTRADGSVYPREEAVEIWRRDSEGKWASSDFSFRPR